MGQLGVLPDYKIVVTDNKNHKIAVTLANILSRLGRLRSTVSGNEFKVEDAAVEEETPT